MPHAQTETTSSQPHHAISCNHCDYHVTNIQPQFYVIDPNGKRINTDSISQSITALYGINSLVVEGAMTGKNEDDNAKALHQIVQALSGKLYRHNCQQCANQFSLNPQKDKHACPHCWSQRIVQMSGGEQCPKCQQGELN
jgi:DNA-directed RNA polymerase subunit RPC12/RpoP